MDSGTLVSIIAVGSLVAVAFLIKFATYLRSMRLRGKTIDIVSNDALRARLSGEMVSIVYLASPKCRVCTMQNPVIDKIKEMVLANIVAVNVLTDTRTAKDFDMVGTPTLIFISGGKIAEIFVGFTPLDTLYATIDRLNKGGPKNV